MQQYSSAAVQQYRVLWHISIPEYYHESTKAHTPQYAPDETGNFAGQSGYGYISFEKFIDAVREVNEGSASLEDIDRRGLPTLSNTVVTTAILEAGRRSLDEGRVVGVEVVGVEPQVK